MQTTKSIFLSKSFWFGILQIVFGVTGLLTGWLESQNAMTLIVTGFATIGIRTTTTQGVHA